MQRKFRWLAVFAVLLLVAAACGDDDDDDTTGTTADGTATTAAGGDTATTGGGESSTSAESTPSTDEAGSGDGVPTADGHVPGLQSTVDEVLGPITLFTDDELANGSQRGVTDDSVTIGGVSSITAGGTPVFFGMCEGVAARIQRANAEGTTEHTINFDIASNCVDDGTNPDTSEQEIQRLVLEENVFALLPTTSQAFFSEDFLNEERVPYFGFGFQPAYCGYGNGFGFADTGAVSCEDLPAAGYDAVTTFTVGAYMAAEGITDPSTVRLANINEDAPAGRSGSERIAIQAETAGVEMVYNEANIPPPTAGPVTDWTPFVSGIIDSDPTVVFITTSGTSGLYEALKNAGYEGDIVGFVFADPGILFAPELAAQLDGSIQINQGLGVSVFGGPTWDQISADAEAVGFNPAGMGAGFTHGYASADFFVTALAATEQAAADQGLPLTTELFYNTINSGFFYAGYGNAVCATEWPASHVAGSPCGSGVQFDVAANALVPLTDLSYYSLQILPL